jgi:hypothetical protein
MRNYEDLQVWQKAHDLTLAIYKETRGFPSDERFGLTSQMRRSGASIGANIAEGAGADQITRWRDLYKLRWDPARSFPITCGCRAI